MPADEVSRRQPKGSRGRSGRAEASGVLVEGMESSSGANVAGLQSPRRFRFRRADRLLQRRDFDRVLGGGRRRSAPELVVVTSVPGVRGRLQNPAGPDHPLQSRLGLTVSRKAGSSVERNRFKRRVREWFRQHRETLDTPLDIVVIARRPGVDLSLEELSRRLARLLASGKSQATGKTQEKQKA